mmetsp:Transcript_90747/g.194634  ORF Transcript_90747/g.194634 Transcript_90747/m.194634 type:complete len:277 (-) Transcript_90747:50-880(-)
MSSAARIRRAPLVALLFLCLVLPTLAYGGKKKSKFLAAYPSLFKFFLFWWCIFVFGVMTVYIIDTLLYKYRGPAHVDFSIEHVFRGVDSRQVYWAQFVDPTTWDVAKHPVLQSADVRTVRVDTEVPPAEPLADAAAASGAHASKRVTPLPEGLVALKPGLGLILRHKEGSGVRTGTLFCTRECTQMETPEDGPWRLVMRTIEVGAGYPFMPDTEESELQLWAPEKDGTMRCSMVGFAAVNSRFFRWWTGIRRASVAGAVAMMEGIEEVVQASKKTE